MTPEEIEACFPQPADEIWLAHRHVDETFRAIVAYLREVADRLDKTEAKVRACKLRLSALDDPVAHEEGKP